MKGFVEEMFYFIVIVLSIFMLFVFFTYQRGTKGVEVRKTVEERLLNEETAAVISTLFNGKLPFVEKTILECGIDAVLQGVPFSEVFYGSGVGGVNVTDVIQPLLDSYAKGRWELTIVTPRGEYTYGKIEKKNVIYSYEALVPVPGENVGKVILSVGSG